MWPVSGNGELKHRYFETHNCGTSIPAGEGTRLGGGHQYRLEQWRTSDVAVARTVAQTDDG